MERVRKTAAFGVVALLAACAPDHGAGMATARAAPAAAAVTPPDVNRGKLPWSDPQVRSPGSGAPGSNRGVDPAAPGTGTY